MMMCIGIIRRDMKTVAYVENGRVVLKTEIRPDHRPPAEAASDQRSDDHGQ